MNKQPTTSRSGALTPFFSAISLAGILPAFILMCGIQTTEAGSATWKLNPSNGDWDNAANWSPSTVPDGTADIATFQSSSTTNVFISRYTEVNAITFNPGASAFSISASPGVVFTLSGTGITNDAGTTQNFVATAASGNDISGTGGNFEFYNSASAGSQGVFTVKGGKGSNGYSYGAVYFFGNSTAGDSTFVNEQSQVSHAYGGITVFSVNSSAGTATLRADGSTILGGDGGTIAFGSTSTAAAATLIANGGIRTEPNIDGFTGCGIVSFYDTSTAANAILIANGVTSGEGGRIVFVGKSNGGAARVEVFGSGDSETRGRLDLSNRQRSDLTIGSLEGDGAVYLAGKNLIVGSNNQDTIFSGEISHTGSGLGGYTPGSDSLAKIGAGKFTLSGANLYSGGTTIKHGRLLVNNTGGSGTGTGPVFVNAGALGGIGTIAGAVTVGNGSGSRALLAPGATATIPGRLAIQSGLTFNSDATYKIQIDSATAKADKAVANDVTINPGAQFTLEDLGTGTLSLGTVFTVINNTSASPIAGRFSNLTDGATFTTNGNTFRADYQGGDGNDLTLKVQ